SCVVHFDPPGEAKDYVHRSGRTARAGASGLVVSLVPSELRSDVKKLQRELGYPLGFTDADLEAVGPVIADRPRSNGSESDGSRSNGSRTGGSRSRSRARSAGTGAKASASQKAHPGRRKRTRKGSGGQGGGRSRQA